MQEQKRGYFQRVHDLTPTRYWVNNPTREQAAAAIHCGAVGCTTNPTYIQKICQNPAERDYVVALIRDMLPKEADDNRVVERLQTKLVGGIAEIFAPVHKQSGGTRGYVSIQGDPFLETADNIVAYGRENAAAAPNIIPKIPVTPAGLAGMETLLRENITMLATEIMSVRQFLDIAALYDAAGRDGDVPPLLFAHIAGIFDEYLQGFVREEGIDILPDILWQAGVAVMKKIERIKAERGYKIQSMNGGARGLHHFTEMVGADSAVTINWVSTSQELLEQDPLVIERFSAKTPDNVIDALRGISVFRQAYDENGIAAADYEAYGPVQLFRSQFENGWREALNLVAKCRAGEA